MVLPVPSWIVIGSVTRNSAAICPAPSRSLRWRPPSSSWRGRAAIVVPACNEGAIAASTRKSTAAHSTAVVPPSLLPRKAQQWIPSPKRDALS